MKRRSSKVANKGKAPEARPEPLGLAVARMRSTVRPSRHFLEPEVAHPYHGRLEVHTHHIISGPRANRTGNWPKGMGSRVVHSHEGGNFTPHEHPNTGPACYGLGRKKLTARPNGEQFPLVAIDPASLTFDVFVMDSALVNDHVFTKDAPFGTLRPISPDDEIGVPWQASIIERKSGLRAVVHDLRSRRKAVR